MSGPFKLLPLGWGDVIRVVIVLCSALPTGEKAKGAFDHGQGPLCAVCTSRRVSLLSRRLSCRLAILRALTNSSNNFRNLSRSGRACACVKPLILLGHMLHSRERLDSRALQVIIHGKSSSCPTFVIFLKYDLAID